jgi:MurNAc alpha-1-phosphate uridylyltransferase
MKAMILAAGLGTRMRPLTDELPKPLLKAGDHSLIEYHILGLAAAGITDIVINLFYLGHKIEEAIGDGARYGVRIHYSPESARLETAGGIINALPMLGSDAFIVVNGDIWTDYSFAKLTGLALGDSLARLVMVDNAGHHPEGDFVLQANGYLGDGSDARAKKLTFSGISVMHPKLFAGMPAGAQPLAPILRQAMTAGLVQGERHDGRWWDIGTPARLALLDEHLGAETR